MGIADCHNKEESHWETDVIQLEWDISGNKVYVV